MLSPEIIGFLKKEASLLYDDLPISVRLDKSNSRRAIYKRLKSKWRKGVTLDSVISSGNMSGNRNI